jgi:two-component system response regulator AtoC
MTLLRSDDLRVPRYLPQRRNQPLPEDEPPLDILFGRTPHMLELRRNLELIARTDLPVLIQGESGTGRDLCARLIHAFSPRNRGGLVKLHCSALVPSTLQAELFGIERSPDRFSSARPGRIEQSHNGTLVLDDFASLEAPMQSMLLQFLQDSTLERSRGEEPQRLSTRIIAIAGPELFDAVESGHLRREILYRLSALTLQLAPLRDRREDLPDLISYFIECHARTFDLAPRPMSQSLLQRIYTYDWPGNLRELDNVLRSHVLLGKEDLLAAEIDTRQPSNEIAAEIDLTQPLSLKEITRRSTQQLERQIILKVLQANGWNRQKTARWLQISYRSLLYKLRDVGVSRSISSPPPADISSHQPGPGF